MWQSTTRVHSCAAAVDWTGSRHCRPLTVACLQFVTEGKVAGKRGLTRDVVLSSRNTVVKLRSSLCGHGWCVHVQSSNHGWLAVCFLS